MVTSVNGGSYEFKQESVGGYWYWIVRANNTQGVGQLYDIIDISTPYGLLINTQIPIPGDIVSAMSDSLNDVKAQLASLLNLIQPATTLFTMTITEGDPDISVGMVDFQNTGAFGSYMTVTATPDSSWLSVSPSSIQGIGKNGISSVSISLLTSTLINSISPYSGIINLQDNRDIPTMIPITVTVIVLPKPSILVIPNSMSFTFALSTSITSNPQVLTITNSGLSGSVLNYTISKLGNVDWLDVTPNIGGPINSGLSITSTVSLVSGKQPSIPGTYMETVRILSANASNSPIDISITLVVS